ncbi:MAG: PP2C family protein-serine/threonine phosphatase [Bacteroidetes bacterium]|nr:PP2C family protein-serine/threonine phosphatase [Bacteroidota bacterium]MCZ2131840.1 PP2C family protein-serine/threonine phosphatase [Bacteroidota bacterium]
MSAPVSASIINLESLIELGARLSEAVAEEFILNSAILSLMGKMRILRACALLPDGDNYIASLAKGRALPIKIPIFEIKDLREISSAAPEELPLAEAGYRYILPVRQNDVFYAALCLGEPPASFCGEELRYISLVGTITANAIQNARTKQSLLRAGEQIAARNLILTSLFETAREFSVALRREDILRMFSYRLMGHLMVNKFALFAQNSAGEYEAEVNRLGTNVPPEIVEEFISMRVPSISEYTTPNSNTAVFLDKAKVAVVSQMKVHGEIKGLLMVSSKLGGAEFSPDDLHFIELLGNTAIAALENSRLFDEEVEKRLIESDLQIAKDIQRQLLPKTLPDLRNFDFAGENISSKHVGGDYFDVIKLDDNRLLLAIADVSGKGIPAALIMANTQAALRVLAPLNLPLPEFVARVNSVIHQNTQDDKFITFFCGILDVRSNELTYINAGHNPPLLHRSDGLLEELNVGGILLGIFDEAPPYDEGCVHFDAGDLLIMYTDGVSEAMNEQSEEFGEERLRMLAGTMSDISADECARRIIAAARNHAGSAPQSDDITLLIVRRIE